MVTTLKPKVRATPTKPMPSCGNPAAITALPHPAKVSQNVPIASATYFCAFMTFSPGLIPACDDSHDGMTCQFLKVVNSRTYCICVAQKCFVRTQVSFHHIGAGAVV